MVLAGMYEGIVDEYLRQEEEAGWVAVAGLVLSAPRGGSVNDGISKATCNSYYVSVKEQVGVNTTGKL